MINRPTSVHFLNQQSNWLVQLQVKNVLSCRWRQALPSCCLRMKSRPSTLIFRQLIRKRAIAVQNVAFSQRKVVFWDFRANNRTRSNQHSAQISFVLCAVNKISRNGNYAHSNCKTVTRNFGRKLFFGQKFRAKTGCIVKEQSI